METVTADAVQLRTVVGGVEVIAAPRVAAFSRELLEQAGSQLTYAAGIITIAAVDGDYRYRAIGWSSRTVLGRLIGRPS